MFPRVEADLLPETRFKRPSTVCVGVRVAAELPDAADRAMRLAAFMVERDVIVVILAETDVTGLERFGFRVERVSGATDAERAHCEEQIRRFWNIDLVL